MRDSFQRTIERSFPGKKRHCFILALGRQDIRLEKALDSWDLNPLAVAGDTATAKGESHLLRLRRRSGSFSNILYSLRAGEDGLRDFVPPVVKRRGAELIN